MDGIRAAAPLRQMKYRNDVVVSFFRRTVQRKLPRHSVRQDDVDMRTGAKRGKLCLRQRHQFIRMDAGSFPNDAFDPDLDRHRALLRGQKMVRASQRYQRRVPGWSRRAVAFAAPGPTAGSELS